MIGKELYGMQAKWNSQRLHRCRVGIRQGKRKEGIARTASFHMSLSKFEFI